MKQGLGSTPEDDACGDGGAKYDRKPPPPGQKRLSIDTSDLLFSYRVKADENACQQHQSRASTEEPAEGIKYEIVDTDGGGEKLAAIDDAVDQGSQQQHKGRPEYLMP